MPSIPNNFTDAVCVPIPKAWVGDGEIKVGRVFVTFANDFGKAKVRVALYQNGKGWRVLTVDLDSSKDPVVIDTWTGESKISVRRLPVDANDKAESPAGFMVQAVLR